MRRVVLLLAVLVCLPLLANAQAYVIQVSSGGNIQVALDQAANLISGPNPQPVIIEVAPGTYTSPFPLNVGVINSPIYSVTLRGVDGPSKTVMDASANAAAILSGEKTQNLIIEGFTFRNRIDPSVGGGRAINLWNATNITVQDCHFDTTRQAIWFHYDLDVGPEAATMSPYLAVIHNTAVGGDCPDPLSVTCTAGQAVNVDYTFPEGTTVTGEPKLIVADNVFRSVGSPVRFLVGLFNEYGGIVTSLPNGTLTMTGNDATSTALGAGHNVLGGRNHYVAGNRFHDGNVGAGFQSAYSYTFENNLVYGNNHGVVLNEGDWLVEPGPNDHRYIRHNTIVNNRGAGIVYSDLDGGEHQGLPDVYNNIVAFNDGGGVVGITYDAATDWFYVLPVSFQMSHNDLYGNTLRDMNAEGDWFSWLWVANPEAAKSDYSGVTNTGEDLSVVLGFLSPEDLDFALKKNSPLRDMGLTTRPTPLRDLFGALRDAKPDIGAAEVVPAPNVNLRSNPKRKGPPPID